MVEIYTQSFLFDEIEKITELLDMAQMLLNPNRSFFITRRHQTLTWEEAHEMYRKFVQIKNNMVVERSEKGE